MFSKATIKERRQYYREEWDPKDLPDFIFSAGMSDTDLLNERSSDIETIYTGEDEQAVRDLIKKYNISYIYIGSLERSMYANINDDLLQSIGTVAYSDGVSTYILKVAD